MRGLQELIGKSASDQGCMGKAFQIHCGQFEGDDSICTDQGVWITARCHDVPLTHEGKLFLVYVECCHWALPSGIGKACHARKQSRHCEKLGLVFGLASNVSRCVALDAPSIASLQFLRVGRIKAAS